MKDMKLFVSLLPIMDPVWDIHAESLGRQKEPLNTLRPRQNGRRFPDDIFKYIFLNENVWISLKISLKFITKVWINNIPPLDR